MLKELLKAYQLWQQTYSSQLVLTEVGNMLGESISNTSSNLVKTSSKLMYLFLEILCAQNFTSLGKVLVGKELRTNCNYYDQRISEKLFTGVSPKL